MKQSRYLNELFENEQYNLIILDACRYDYFEKVNNIPGQLKKVFSNSGHTYEWLFRNIDMDLKDVKVFSGHPTINSKGITPPNWIPPRMRNYPTWKSTDYFSSDNIVDLWSEDHQLNKNNIDIRKADPRKITNYILEEGKLKDKNIIWYMDPHHPYIGSDNLPNIAQKDLWRDYSNEEIHRGYIKDLKLTLKSVSELVKTLSGDIVITSDHGDELDINRKFPFHRPCKYTKNIIEVPWLVVDKDESN